MLGDPLRVTTRHWLFPNTDIHTECADRHSELGRFLDQPRVDAGARLARTAHRASNEHALGRCPRVTATRVLYQGHRRVDVSVSDLRLLVVNRVCVRQRLLAEETHSAAITR